MQEEGKEGDKNTEIYSIETVNLMLSHSAGTIKSKCIRTWLQRRDRHTFTPAVSMPRFAISTEQEHLAMIKEADRYVFLKQARGSNAFLNISLLLIHCF